MEDLLELTPQKDVLFIIGDWNAKVRSRETPGITSKFGLGVQNEVGQRLIEFCKENIIFLLVGNFDLVLKEKQVVQNGSFQAVAEKDWRTTA